MAKIEWRYLNLSDAKVVDFLSKATDASNQWRSKIHLAKNSGCKRYLRVHRDRHGRHFVRYGYKGAGRAYLADRVELTTIDGEISTLLFNLEIYSEQEAA